jgi:hypothetical protein
MELPHPARHFVQPHFGTGNYVRDKLLMGSEVIDLIAYQDMQIILNNQKVDRIVSDFFGMGLMR